MDNLLILYSRPNSLINMAKFVTGKELENVVYEIIWNAEKKLMLVSPFIRLDNYFKELLNKHINDHKLHIIVVFGKNESNVSKSLSKDDFNFLKQFLNVSIVYVSNLHGKYYGNESRGVITSINLHDYSFKNNIEFGVYSEASLLNNLTSKSDLDAWETCSQIAGENEAVFIKRPVYERKILGKNYIKSDILHDTTEKFYGFFKDRNSSVKKLNDFPSELDLGAKKTIMPTREEIEIEAKYTKKPSPSNDGYCIRTGTPIPFNPSRPFCESAYRSWVFYENWDFPESFCHKTGIKSHGETSMRNPILKHQGLSM